MYFSWFKVNNHLYKNIELDSNLISDFEAESLKLASEFENNTKEDDVVYLSDDDEEIEVEEVDELFCKGNDNEPLKSADDEWTHNKTTMFLNKYCEDINVPTVANRMADMIIDFEMSKRIPIENEDDFDVDDEIISEEQFLKNIDEELDNNESSQNNEHLDKNWKLTEELKKIDIIDQLAESEDEEDMNVQTSEANTHHQLLDNLDMICNPTDKDSEDLCNKSLHQAKRIL